jgi:hypothetical protein
MEIGDYHGDYCRGGFVLGVSTIDASATDQCTINRLAHNQHTRHIWRLAIIVVIIAEGDLYRDFQRSTRAQQTSAQSTRPAHAQSTRPAHAQSTDRCTISKTSAR